VVGLLALRTTDGPIGPIAGGPFTTGTLVAESDVDWSAVFKGEPQGSIEFQLVEPPRSRTAGGFIYEGVFYVPCDLGFIWRRAPSTRARMILGTIWFLKRWHHDAERDGRAVFRIDGKLYERQLVRVTDPELIATLRGRIEAAAAGFFGGSLLPEPGDPEAVWFFRADPRPAT
jgi:hypothetical protein